VIKKEHIEFHILAMLFFPILAPLWSLGMIMKDWSIYSLIIASIFGFIFLFHWKYFYRVRGWQKVEGKYHQFRIDRIDVFDGIVWGTIDRYRPSFKYTYSVDGYTYGNDKLSLLDKDYDMGSREDASKLVKINQKEKTLPVYYNPKNPQESMLLPSFSGGKKLQLYIFLFFSITLILKEFINLYFPEPFYIYLMELLK